MPFVVVFFGGRMTLTFGRQGMNDNWSIFDLLGFFQRGDQRPHIVTVNVSDVFEAELVNERAGQDRGRDRIFHSLGRMMQSFAN